MRTTPAILVTLAALLGACSDPLDEVWQLTNYRVLGARNDPPESEPGEMVTLSLASADTHPRDVTTVWFLCNQRISTLSATSGSGGSAFGGCPAGQSQLQTGATVQFVTPPLGGGTLDDEGREQFTVIGFSCAGGSIGLPNSRSNGLPTCNGSDAQGRMFVRSIYARTPAALNAPNHNPAIREVRFGPVGATQPILESDRPEVTACADQTDHRGCTQYAFELGFEDGSRETFVTPDPLGGPQQHLTERLTVEYLVSAGTVDGAFRADSAEDPNSVMQNTWYAPATAGEARIWIYGNDGRGGFDWTMRTVVVR